MERFFGWLFVKSCVFGCLLIDSLVGWLVGWLADWLVGWLADWLVGWLTD